MKARVLLSIVGLAVCSFGSLQAQEKVVIPEPSKADATDLVAGAKLNVFLVDRTTTLQVPVGTGAGVMVDEQPAFRGANFAQNPSLAEYAKQAIVASRWNGYLKVSEPGSYYFTFAVNNTGRWSAGVLIEGETVFENIYRKKPSPPGQEVELKPGFYKIAVWMSQVSGSNLHGYGKGELDFRVRKPGDTSAQPITPAKLYRDK